MNPVAPPSRSPEPKSRTRVSGVVTPQTPTLGRKLLAWFLFCSFWLLMRTWRRRWLNNGEADHGQGPVIFCVWHNRLAVGVAGYDQRFKSKWPADGIVGMISASRDGGLLAAILNKFGVQAIRGSTSRRGPQALLEATTLIEKNHHIVITPDGPRGPRYKIQEGILLLSQLTGRPIVPVSSKIGWKWRLKSWDRFVVPLPFARVQFRYGPPMFVPRDISDAAREQLRQQLEQTMMSITED